MKRQVLQIRLCRIAHLISGVLLANLILLAEPVLAEQLQEFRLFHEPMNNAMDDVMKNDMNDAQLTNLNQSQAIFGELQPPNNQQGIRKSEHKRADLSTAKPSDTGGNAVYQYNGFISTASSRYFLINGLPLSDIDSLILVSVKRGGKSLVLKTPNGRPFELAVGQSVTKGSL